jgi:hypothetical protein
MNSDPALNAPSRPRRRRIELSHRTCIIDADRIAIRPSSAALVPPALGLCFGAACFGLIMADVVLWRGGLPFALLIGLLAGAVILIPLSAMGFVYGAIGANVLIDRAKGSATWQQGLLGLGVGTADLVPFWKIEAIVVDETGAAIGRSTEELAQWEISLRKKSGTSLSLGQVSAPRVLAGPSLERALEVGAAVAALTGAPLHAPAQSPATATADLHVG